MGSFTRARNYVSGPRLRFAWLLGGSVLSVSLYLGPGTTDAHSQTALFGEDFSAGLGGMTEVVVCGNASRWSVADTCAASPDAPSPPTHARFGEIPGCSTYSSGDVSINLETPEVSPSGCLQTAVQLS